MFTKRRLRFSIGAILVLMAGVAVLLNHEVQRAKAIEKTVNKIEGWLGEAHFKRREYMPQLLASVLPKYWSQSIFFLEVALYIEDQPQMSHFEPYATIEPDEFEQVIELGALDELFRIKMQGSAINYSNVFHICESSGARHCLLTEVALSDAEIAKLRDAFPHCLFYVNR